MYELLARYYDQLHSTLTADLPFVLSLAREGGGPVLDLGCGTGRLLFPLAEAGFEVTGIDNSPQMLEIARTRLASKPELIRQLVTLCEKDIRSLSGSRTTTRYKLALLSYNTLLHIREAEIGPMLKGIGGLLDGGSSLFVDLENPFLLAGVDYPNELVFETSFMDEVINRPVELSSFTSLDTKAQTLVVTWQFHLQGEESGDLKMQMIYHYYYPHQILLLLQQAGFSLGKMLGSYEGDPFQEDSERLLLLASFMG
jgi:SAM-dependent methyltransferase